MFHLTFALNFSKFWIDIFFFFNDKILELYLIMKKRTQKVFSFSFFYFSFINKALNFGRFKEARCRGRKSEETRSRRGNVKVCLAAKYSHSSQAFKLQVMANEIYFLLLLFLMNYKEPELPR
jgi:hypothetical protein